MLVASILVGLMVAVGFILLVVPGIYLSGVFMFTVVAMVVERSGITESLGISRGLVKGYWWRSMTILTIGIIIMMVFSFIGGLVNGVLVAVFGLGSSMAVMDRSIIGVAINVFLLSLVPCFLLTTYFDLKLRHEGGDLAARVDALAAR
jgi:hypothetical protein